MPVVKYKDSQGQIKKVPLILPLDDALSSSSTNGVQNKVLKEALDGKGTYSAPSSGIPKTDLAIGVQTSLGKADTALQSVPNTYRTASAQDEIDSAQNTAINAKYTKPSTGIPASDLAAGVIPTVPTQLSQLTEDSTHRTVTDTEKTTWNDKQNALGFTPENAANKVTSIPSSSTDTQYPSAKAVYDAVSGKENKGKITISGIEKTANTHTVTIVTNGETTTLTLVGVS